MTALADLETVNQPTVVGPPRDRYGRYDAIWAELDHRLGTTDSGIIDWGDDT